MPIQDRSGSNYEQLLTASLSALGYEFNSSIGKNFLHPSKRSQIVIPNTYIQPDIVLRDANKVSAILYATHWSNARSSKYKFWRTWEECAQQKLALNSNFLSINCVFEALPNGTNPLILKTADELPKDTSRDSTLPITFRGWYPAITWAMIESFDLTIAFPIGYEPVKDVIRFKSDEHDEKTTKILKQSLSNSPKVFLNSQWDTLRKISNQSRARTISLLPTRSRYRIGLLHVYLFYRLTQKILGAKAPTLKDFVASLVEKNSGALTLEKLSSTKAFKLIKIENLRNIFQTLEKIYVRKGTNPQMFCKIETFSHPDFGSIERIRFNNDLQICLSDLKKHLNDGEFISSIERAFLRFDKAQGVIEALDDIADLKLVSAKESFVRSKFQSALGNSSELNLLLQKHAKELTNERKTVSKHQQNWLLEMILYLAGLNSAEDIYTRIRPAFEKYGHRLRPHAPYGDDTHLISYLIRGKDISESWSENSTRRTLGKDEFYTLSWQAVADCISQAFTERGNKISTKDEITARYLGNKSMRIISSELNGFFIMIDYYLGDICDFVFDEDSSQNESRICAAWQTDLVNELWGGRPLETWMEGVSKNAEWFIKIQSAQDGNEGHKTKELAGRSRAVHLEWKHGNDKGNRNEWIFAKRKTKKFALILDGDWDTTKKKNLYEAGWDWVGDVSQLGELRKLIGGNTE